MIPKYGLNFKLITAFFLALFLIPSLLFAAPLETVTNTNDVGGGSLRQAIADVDAGGNIVFDISQALNRIQFSSQALWKLIKP